MCLLCVGILGQGLGFMGSPITNRASAVEIWSALKQVQTEPNWVALKYPECMKLKVLLSFFKKNTKYN